MGPKFFRRGFPISLRYLPGVLATVWLVFAPASAQKVEYGRIDRGIVEERLRRVSNDNTERKATLENIFEEAGCGGERLSEQSVAGAKLPNLICSLPGTTDSIIIVGAHFDHVPIGEGAADNWSGAALLPSLYQSLQDRPRRHTFLFIGFTDEEKGLVGSSYYARQLKPAQVGQTRAMVNLDTLGLSTTKVWESHADSRLVDALYRVAKSMNLRLEAVNVEEIGTADSESFAKRKIPAITLHSVTQKSLPILHSPRDRISALNLEDYYDSYRLVAAYLAFLDTTLDSGSAQEKPLGVR